MGSVKAGWETLLYWSNEMLAFMDKGGFIMLPLFILTMLLWYSIGYRYWLLRRSRLPLHKLLNGPPRSNRHPRDLVEHAVGIGHAVKAVKRVNLRRHLDAEFYPLEHEVQRFSAAIKSAIVVAPSLGLLGTVSGMIETFDAMAEMNIYGQSGGIAGGIAEALYATQMGLAVAIPGVLVKLWLDLKQKRIQAELEQIKDLLCLDSQ
jgi:biopolymer transport protein ExbB